MMLLWLVHMVRVLLQFRHKRFPSADSKAVPGAEAEQPDDKKLPDTLGGQSDSDSSSYGHVGTPSSVLYPGSPLLGDRFSSEHLVGLDRPSESQIQSSETSPASGSRAKRKRSTRRLKTFSRIRKLLSFHVGIPLCLAIFVYTTYTTEVFFTASPMITRRYFGWSGARTGTFLGWLAIMILPSNFVCEIVARRYEERTVIKRALLFVAVGLFVMINWVSFYSLATRATKLFTETNGRPDAVYDWRVGMLQYVIGLTVIVLGSVSLEGAAVSLLSKLSPAHSPTILISVPTIATFLGFAARLVGDTQVVMVDLSEWLINTDIINALVLPLLLVCFALHFFVKKHFFFLM
jgi:hypothetical protein